MKPLLLHVCCGPCAAGSLPRLRGEGYEPQGYFLNPNIHPLTEFLARRDALREFAREERLPLEEGGYGLVEFLQQVVGHESERCRRCYAMRLGRAAHRARERGIGSFSTTLLYSIHQDHDLIRETGQRLAGEAGVEFVYLDLRDGWRAGREAWRLTGRYCQKYCGCVYSEMERYGNRA